MNPAAIATKDAARILEVDRVKGIFILLILLYHSLNYSERYYLGFQLLGWLPVSFIFVTGFLISSIYSGRFDQARRKISSRLLSRGAKLVLLFTILNIGISLLRKPGNQSVSGCIQAYFGHWWDVYVTGEGRFASFQVLLPIAYFLMVSPVLIQADLRQRWFLPFLVGILLPVFEILDLQSSLWTTLALMSAGIPGMLAGKMSLKSYDRLEHHLGKLWLGYAALFAFGLIFGQTYLVQLLEACFGIAIVYALCARAREFAKRRGWVAMLGEYSLLSYIVQIAALQVLVRIVGRPSPYSIRFLILLGGAGAIMLAIITVVDRCRSRSQTTAGLYKAVFA